MRIARNLSGSGATLRQLTQQRKQKKALEGVEYKKALWW
jgi:hypothetical protein